MAGMGITKWKNGQNGGQIGARMPTPGFDIMDLGLGFGLN